MGARQVRQAMASLQETQDRLVAEGVKVAQPVVTTRNWVGVLDSRLRDLRIADGAIAIYRSQAQQRTAELNEEAQRAAAAVRSALNVPAERLTPNHLGVAVRLRIDGRVHEGNLTALNAEADLIDEHPLSSPGPRYVVGRRRIELTLDGRWTFRVLGTDEVELIEQGGGA